MFYPLLANLVHIIEPLTRCYSEIRATEQLSTSLSEEVMLALHKDLLELFYNLSK